MKKKLFFMLLPVLLICTMLAVGASAQDGVQDTASAVYIDADGIMEHCLCGNAFVANAEGEVHYRSAKLADGCIGECEGEMLQWQPTATIPTGAGNWYLTDSYTATAMTIIGNDLNLDLNGKVVTMGQGGAARFLRIDKNVSITDTVGTGAFIKDAATSYTVWGTGVWVYNGGTLNLYAGTLDGNNAAGSADAGVLLISGGSAFNMYGGTIQNGKGAYGGNVKVEGTMYLYDGTISGGTAGTGGGNLYVTGANAVVHMSGGTITGGSGNGNWGGNVTLYNKGTMNMSGGKIVDGIAGGAVNALRSNMMIRDAVLNISGGYISGGISSFVAAGTINASGSAQIYNEKGGKQINLLDGTNIAININVTGALNSDAKIMVSGGAAGAVAVTGSGYTLTEADVAAVWSDVPGYVLEQQDNKIVCVTAGEETYCVCGGKAVGVGNHVCQDVTWTPWTNTTKLPTTTGNYYLTAPVYCTAAQAANEGQQISLDLRGYKVNFAMADASADPRCYHVKAGSVLNITDTVGGGAFVKDGTKSYTAWGSFIWVRALDGDYANGGTVNLFAGTLEGSNVASSGHSGIMLVSSGGTFNMYGGSVQNGKAVGGGNITLDGGIMNLYEGTVAHGVAMDGTSGKEGGNIWVKAAGELNMHGGKITYGVGHNNWGGNILVQGKMTMTGGQIYAGNGDADAEGANVVLNGNGSLTMSGGHIHGRLRQFNSADTVLNVSGSAKIYNSAGGNQINFYWDDSKQLKINVTGEFNDDAKIALNGAAGTVLPVENAKAEYAPYFCGNGLDAVYADGKLTLMEKGTVVQCVCGGKAVGVGDHVCQNVVWKPWTSETTLPSTTGNYYLTGTVTLTTTHGIGANQNVALDLRGQTVTANGANVRLYNVINDNATLSITDSVGGGSLKRIDEGEYSANGGILWAWGTNTLNLYAGAIDGGNAKNTANGLIHCAGTFNMYGGEVKNGKAANGGNVYMNGGTMNLYAGTISAGTADIKGGNVVIENDATLTMTGGSILGGKGNGNWGGNLLVYGGSMTMTGGEISGGITDAKGLRANVCLRNTTLNMSGGYISGGVASFMEASTVNVSGSAKIYNDTEGAVQLMAVTDTHVINVNVAGALNADACIRISGNTVVTGAKDVLEAVANKQVVTAEAGKEFTYDADRGGLIVLTTGARLQCVCGGKAVGVGNHVCQEVEFMPWVSGDSLPEAADFTATSAYYYLTQDVVCADTLAVYGSGSIAIDLNGHSITCSMDETAHVYNWVSHGTLSITDSVGGGKVILPEGAGNIQGKMFWIRQGTFNLYAGTLDGNNVTMTADGAVVQVSATDNPGVFNMYGGIIENGSAKNGGNIKLVEGTMNMYGGIVRNGTAQQTLVETQLRNGYGGNVYVDHGCALNLFGGTITGGQGHNIYVTVGGKLAMNGTVTVDEIYLAGGLMDLGETFSTETVIELGILGGGKIANATQDYTDCFDVEGSYELFYDGNGQIWYGGKIAVVDALGNQSFYMDLQEAVNAASGKESYVKLLAEQTGDITVTGAVYLDLNGFVLNGDVSGEGTLYVMDSATDDYNCADMGRITGTVSCQKPQVFKAFGKRYLVIADETGYTAHRFYLGVTHISLKPANFGVGYKAAFYGDEMVLAQVTSYGYKLNLQGQDTVLAKTKPGAFVSGEAVTLRISNYDIENYADTALSASVFIELQGGVVIESATVSRTFHEIFESVDATFTQFTDGQKEAAVTMYDAALMAQWNLPNMTAYIQQEANVELASMNVVYAENISDTTVKQLKNISGEVSSETKKKITCESGEYAANTLYVSIDSTMEAGTYRVQVTQTGVRITGADQLGAYYGVLYFRDSVMTAPSAVKAEGSWKIPALDITSQAETASLSKLSSGTVNVLWERVANLEAPKTGQNTNSSQGSCYDGNRYVYQAYINLVDGNGGVIACYDTQDNWKLARVSQWIDQLGHGNDMAYKDGKLYIAQVVETDRRVIGVVDAETLLWDESFALTGDGVDRTGGIAYNANYDSFVTYSSIDGFSVFDGDFNYQRMFTPYEPGLTNQGICCDNSYIYQILWDEKDREDVSDAILVYDWSGNCITMAEIWLEFDQTDTEDGYTSMIESKGTFMIDGQLYGVFQDWNVGVFVAELQFVRG